MLLASILLSIVLLITVLFSLILLVIVFSIFVIWLPTWPFNSSIAFLLAPISVRFSIASVPATLMSFSFWSTRLVRPSKSPLTPSTFTFTLLILLLITLLFSVIFASIFLSTLLMIVVLLASILLLIVFSTFVICVPTWPFKSLIAFSLLEIRVELASIRLLLSSIALALTSVLALTLLMLLLITVLFFSILASILPSTLLMIVVLLASIFLLIVVSILVICVPTWPFNSSIAFWFAPISVRFSIAIVPTTLMSFVLAFTPSSTIEILVELSEMLSCK